MCGPGEQQIRIAVFFSFLIDVVVFFLYIATWIFAAENVA